MDKEQLITHITYAFNNEPYVGDDSIVYNNSPQHTECNELKNAFKGKDWRDLDHKTIFDNKDSIPFFSSWGLKYYAPALMIDVLNDYYESDTLSDNLIQAMILPQEIDAVIMANNIKKYKLDKQNPDFDFEEFLYGQLDTTNERVKKFIQWTNLFNLGQKKTIFQFLSYLDENFSNEYEYNPVKPRTAIDRFWFQYA